jgi:hypothetical protein
VPLYDIATAGIGSVVVPFLVQGTLIIAVMITTSACNNGLIMAGASVLYDGARRSFLQESR